MSHHGSSACTASDLGTDFRVHPRRSLRAWVEDPPPPLYAVRNEPVMGATTGDALLATEFGEHVARWVADTAHLSSPVKQVSHPSYLRIVGMGPLVLPLILAELERRARYWFPALTAITGVQPILERDFGDIRAMRDAWLKWGRDHGYLA